MVDSCEASIIRVTCTGTNAFDLLNMVELNFMSESRHAATNGS